MQDKKGMIKYGPAGDIKTLNAHDGQLSTSLVMRSLCGSRRSLSASVSPQCFRARTPSVSHALQVHLCLCIS